MSSPPFLLTLLPRVASSLRGGIAVALILFVPSGGVLAQTAGVSPLASELQPSQYLHDVWTVEDGLPQNAVYAVKQTADGYVWIGTQNGLARFDGIRFEALGSADGLPNGDIGALLEGRDGSLWIGSNGGISRFKDGEITTWTSADGLSSNVVRSLYEDDKGILWIGTIDGGLNTFDGNEFEHFTSETGLAGDVALAIAEDGRGDLWVGTERGLSRYSNGAFQNYTVASGLPDPLVWSILPNDDGSLWVGTNGGLSLFAEGQFETYTRQDGLCGNVVNALREDRSGGLWIGTLDGGLCRLKNGRFDSFRSALGEGNDRVRAIEFDLEGNLWVGSEGGGLSKLREGKFYHISTSEGLSHHAVFSVLEDADGTVWIGTEGGGLNRLDDRAISHIGRSEGLPSDDVYALGNGRDGVIWIGMYGGGVCRLSRLGELTCYSTDDGLNSDNIYAVYEDRHGDVWIGTEAGLFTLRNGEISAFTQDPDLAHAAVTTIHEDRQGRLWIGTYGDGLRWIVDDEIGHVTSTEGLSNDIVLVLHEDPNGHIWVGTYGGGLCRVGGSEIECVTSDQGLHDDNILQILEDDEGYLWIGTLQGIARMKRTDVSALLDGGIEHLSVESFGSHDGLRTTESSGGTQPAAWRTRDGRLWFASNKGVAVIDPARIGSNPIPPAVYVEGMYVDGGSVSMRGAIELPAGTRDLTLRYTGISLTAPEEVRFQYRLEGYDANWVDAGTRREAFYTNLSPGSYRFVVRAANNDGLWNEKGASLSFHLEPFFYQTWWFKWLAIAAAFAFAFAGYRLRIRQLKERERELEQVVDERTRDLRREKERVEEGKRVIEGQAEKLRELDRFKTKFFANISHEFRTPLTMIVGPLENMLGGQYEPLSDRMAQQVEMMLRNALRLLRLINQLLDLSKLEDGKMQLRAGRRNIVPFLEGIVLSCTALAERKGIDLQFASDEQEIMMVFEPDKLEKVFYNLLSNASKFTPKNGRISMSLHEVAPSNDYPEGSICVRLEDTGTGIPDDQLPYIFDRFHQVEGSSGWEHEGTGIGLALVKELVLLHGGKVDVTSRLGEGTTFAIILPKGVLHLDQGAIAEGETDANVVEHGGMMSELATSDFNYMHEDEEPIKQKDRPIASEDAPIVLVVDDNKDVREYVEGILDDVYRVITARDGAEGILRAREIVPDLILSDVMMPNVDGNEFCRIVKSSPDLNHIPFILLTARATHNLKIEGLEVGADDYIPKPFNVHELRVRIKNLLRLRSQEKELREVNDSLEDKVQAQYQQLVDERRRYEDELITAKDKAEASDRLKSNILNNLSHEFRTPLTAIMGFAQIIELEAAGEIKEFADEINRGGMRLLRTLDSLLHLSRIESDLVELPDECVDLGLVVSSIADRFRSPAAEKQLNFTVQVAVQTDLEIELDRSALGEVVSNLIDNAVKFTNEGEITIECGRVGENVFVRVSDTGVGIRPEFVSRIYEAFLQESEGLSRSYEGCGLGLTVTKRLVEAVGGSIEVDSTHGTGSVFTVTFPAADPIPTPAPATHVQQS